MGMKINIEQGKKINYVIADMTWQTTTHIIIAHQPSRSNNQSSVSARPSPIRGIEIFLLAPAWPNAKIQIFLFGLTLITEVNCPPHRTSPRCTPMKLPGSYKFQANDWQWKVRAPTDTVPPRPLFLCGDGPDVVIRTHASRGEDLGSNSTPR